MEYRTRRERRDAERAGLISNVEARDEADIPRDFRQTEAQAESTQDSSRPLSRRELREQTRIDPEPTSAESSYDVQQDLETNEKEAVTGKTSFVDYEAEQIQPEQPTEEPLTAKSYLYQESSNTFTLDSIPDSLTSTNGDLVVTNSESIAVVTGSHPTMSSVMDDLKYDSEDQKDTVAGKISLVDPVSAKLVADSREPEVIVPGKIVVRNRALSVTFAVVGGVMFLLAGLGLWWALSEMGPFSS